MSISDEVEGVLHRAFVGAREAWHPIITPEHIALEVILESETAAFLERCGTDLVAVESRLREYLEKIEPNEAPDLETIPTSTFQSIVGNAMQRVRDDGREHVMLRDLFLALIDERSTVASAAILEATSDRQAFEELRAYVSPEERGAA